MEATRAEPAHPVVRARPAHPVPRAATVRLGAVPPGLLRRVPARATQAPALPAAELAGQIPPAGPAAHNRPVAVREILNQFPRSHLHGNSKPGRNSRKLWPDDPIGRSDY